MDSEARKAKFKEVIIKGRKSKFYTIIKSTYKNKIIYKYRQTTFFTFMLNLFILLFFYNTKNDT